MARKRKLNWGPVLWLATCVNVSLGLAYSPITSAAKVRVVGALPTDEHRIAQAVQLLSGKPALRSGAELSLEQLYRRPDVRNAAWSQNLFRRGLLELAYDQPVATLADPPTTVLTAGGQFVQTREPLPEGIPALELFDTARDPGSTLGSPFESVKIADVCSRAATLGIANLTVVVQANGAVCLNSGKTGRVSLGSTDELDLKFEKLQEILAKQPEILSKNQDVVLLSPQKPMVRSLVNQ